MELYLHSVHILSVMLNYEEVRIESRLCFIRNIHELLIYVDDVHILGGSVHTIKENAEDLVVASKEIGLEVNADKTKYMVMSRDQNTGRSHIIKNDNSSVEKVEEFRYVGTSLTN